MLGPGAEGELLPIEVALSDGGPARPLADELVRLERMLPVAAAARAPCAGARSYLSQDEAWELMTVTGAELEAAGFDVRVPALSRRKADAHRSGCSPSPPASRTSVRTSSATCAGRCVFDDVELTAAEIARLAAEARPLVRPRAAGSSSTGST